jgi:hypothetical protein
MGADEERADGSKRYRVEGQFAFWGHDSMHSQKQYMHKYIAYALSVLRLTPNVLPQSIVGN